MPLSNSKRTISIWVKYNDITAANYIWGYGSLANAQYFGLLQKSTSASRSDLNLAGCGDENDVIVSTAIASGIWYNYTVTYDGLTSKIYRNGELIKSSISPRKITSSVVFGIGKMGPAISINADIDDLKIYDVALTAAEVASIYNSGYMLPVNEVVIAPVETMSIKSSEIYSSQGFKVLSADKNEIDITALPEGTYLLKISNILQQDSASKKLTSN